MFLQVLGALERLATPTALVWLQWNMNTDVGSNVITLDSGGVACAPRTGQVQIIGALAADVLFANVQLKS
jgi:hypothetical protein